MVYIFFVVISLSQSTIHHPYFHQPYFHQLNFHPYYYHPFTIHHPYFHLRNYSLFSAFTFAPSCANPINTAESMVNT